MVYLFSIRFSSQLKKQSGIAQVCWQCSQQFLQPVFVVELIEKTDKPCLICAFLSDEPEQKPAKKEQIKAVQLPLY